MTAPRFLVPPGSLGVDGPFLLDGPEGRHAARVRRIGVGERVDLADGTGLVAECVVATAGPDSLRLEVVRRHELPAPEPRFTAVQALPKGDRGELAVEVLTEIGVDEIVPWAAARCVTRWEGPRGERSAARWAAHAREAAKQARRARVPVVSAAAGTAEIARRLAAATLPLVLHEDAAEPLSGLAVPAVGEIVVVIGPEGGVDDAELAAFAAAGAHTVRLGPEILRTSTAGVVAFAVLAAGTVRWGADPSR